MRSLLLLEFLNMYRALHIIIPILILPTIILCSSIFLPFDQGIFIFSSVFSMQMLMLLSPLLLSEILKGGWRLIYQAGIIYDTFKVIPTIIFSSIIIALPAVSIFASLYTILLSNLFSLTIFISLLSICLFSYAVGSFFKALLNDQIHALILCILYEVVLLPFTMIINYYPTQNFSGMMWPLLILINNIVNPSVVHIEFELISNIECFSAYFFLVIISSWLLCRRIKL
ncbi:MAG: hypothetical protein QXZ49_00990 [Nitrososphaerota archaeon]